jgi:hypothetical protein
VVSEGAYFPNAWLVPEKKCVIRTAFDLSALSAPAASQPTLTFLMTSPAAVVYVGNTNVFFSTMSSPD